MRTLKASGASRRAAIAAVAAVAAIGGVARADDTREKQLEDRVRDLEKQLTEVQENLRGGYFTASSDMEARVSELEKLVADDKGGMVSYFKGGMKSESTDGMHKFSVYGRVQNDWFWFDADSELEDDLGEDMNGGTEFRRVRLGAEGQMYGNVKFKSEIDFAGAEVEFADVYMELSNCSFGSVRVGHFDEPFGLDRLTSSRFTTFLERNMLTDAFAPARNTGIMVHGNAMEDALVYQAGMFRDADGGGDDTGNEDEGEYNFTGRLAWRPMVEDDGNTYLHVGAAVSYRDYSNDEARFRARPNVHATPRFVDTGTFEAETGMHYGLEAAFVASPFSVQGEFAMADVDSDAGDDPSFKGFSLEASYFLTGETRQYSKSKGAFDRNKVKKNYGDADGIGSWQVGVRYDTLDLNDGAIEGGEIDTWTVGLNWWLNPNTRVGMNVVHAEPDDLEGDMTALVFRFQVDF